MKRKLLAFAGAAAVTAGALSVAVAAPAFAGDDYNGVCDAYQYIDDPTSEFCLYYHVNLTGSLWDKSSGDGPDYNLGDNHFIAPGDGHGQVVRNNAASARDRDYDETVHLFYSPNMMGTVDIIYSDSWLNDLGPLKNNEASYVWTE